MVSTENRIRMTNSSRSMYGACARRYQYRYIVEIVPNRPKPENLAFGTEIHDYLEALYKNEHTPGSNNPYVNAMTTMYGKYAPQFADWEVVEVEYEFVVPIVNPATGAPSRTYVLAGKVDLVLRHRITGEYAIVDHKTASKVDGAYIDRASHNAQLYTYCFALMKEKGWNITTLFFNILEKSTLRRRMATAPEKIKYKQDGSLYANVRLEDEPDTELYERLIEWHDNPEKYQLVEVGVDQRFLEETHCDLWGDCQRMMLSRRTGFYPRNTGNCFQYNRQCEYVPLCLHLQEPQVGPEHEWIKKRAHEELEQLPKEVF